MSKNVAVFVDVANLYYSARGQEVDVDYVALLKAATKGRDLIRAYAYSGLDPENENQRKFIDFLNKNGYKVIHKDIRKFGDGRVKANLDIELVVDLFRLADRMDIAVVISGDGDFAPAIRALQDKGVRCEVISFRPNTSSDLIAVADEFIDIMKIIGIGRGKDAEKAEKADKVMSAPPMPAKEVVPEFGFREAPASVAAAALAALREGKDVKDGKPAGRVARGRGRGRAAVEAAPPEAVTAEISAEVAAPSASEAVTDEGGERRRRRRRGGRGRGRGGRGRTGAEAAAETPGEGEAAPAGEIGWVELDDISQVDDFDALAGPGDEEPREYTFEEADAATLAELGIAPVETAATAESTTAKPRRSRPAKPPTGEAVPAAAAPKARRPRAAKPRGAEATPAAETAQTAETAEAPKARRPRAARPKAEDAATSADAAAAPRPRRSRPAKGQEATPDATEDGQEGIWQRFRSGRTS